MKSHSFDRRSLRTRQSLRSALATLIQTLPYDQITVQTILDAANIGRATFYCHFYDKDDLLCHSVAWVFSTLYQQQASQEPAQLFPICGILAHIAEHQALYIALSRSQVFEQMLRAVHTSLSQTIQQHLNQFSVVQTRLELPAMSHYLAGGCLSVIRWWLAQSPMPGLESVAATIDHMALPSLEHLLQRKP